MENFTALTGKTNANGIPEFPSLPGGMKNDGTCVKENSDSNATKVATIPFGFFKVGLAIGYSNGGGYCLFDSMENLKKLTGKTNADDIKEYNSFPTEMENQGVCLKR